MAESLLVMVSHSTQLAFRLSLLAKDVLRLENPVLFQGG